MNTQPQFTEQESLRVIDEMIRRTKNTYTKGVMSAAILFGWASAIVAVIYMVLHWYYPPQQVIWIWLLLLVMAVISSVVAKKKSKPAMKHPKTQIDRIVVANSVAMLIGMVIFIGISIFVGWYFKTTMAYALFAPVCFILTGIYLFITAKAMRWNPLYIGAAAFWLGAVLYAILPVFGVTYDDWGMAVFAFCMVFGFAIPGHLIEREARKTTPSHV